MKKLLVIILILPLFICLITETKAQTLEFTFGEEKDLQDELEDSLPEDIKNELEENTDRYDFGYFFEKAVTSLKNAAGKGIKTVSALAVIVIIAASSDILSDSMCLGKTREAFGFCSCLCMSLALWEVFRTVLDTADILLNTLSSVMLGIVPVMEGALIYSGNIGAAAVQGTGVNLMIALGENVFSKALFPGAVICFFSRSHPPLRKMRESHLCQKHFGDC